MAGITGEARYDVLEIISRSNSRVNDYLRVDGVDQVIVENVASGTVVQPIYRVDEDEHVILDGSFVVRVTVEPIP